MHTDKYGVIGQIQGDGSVEGGDSVCWMGHWLYLNNGEVDEWNVDKFIYFFEVAFGAYVRHPDPTQTNNGFGAHYKNPWNGCITRDQLTGILAALIVGKKHYAMFRVVIHHLAWLVLFSYSNITNGVDPKTARWKIGDLTLFDIWSMQIRGLGVIGYILYPLLVILDIHILLSTIFTNYQPDTENDVINHTVKLLISNEYLKTPFSWLAWKICDKESLLRKLSLYWTGWRDNPEYMDLYIKKFNSI